MLLGPHHATAAAKSAPPLPTDAVEAARVEHTRLRRRLLYGLWRDDVVQRMRCYLGSVRAEAIGEPDMAGNPFEATCSAAAALYDRMPRLHQPDAASLTAMQGWTERAMLYPLMSRVQRDVLGLREEFVRVQVHLDALDRPQVSYVPVPPDMGEFRADPRDPSRPIEVREWVERPNPQNGEPMWTQDYWSIDGAPVHQVLDASGNTDLSEHYGLPAGGLVGDAYPAIRADGVPILPYATYHAALTGRLLDPWYRAEMIQGTLNVCVLWTFLTHIVRNASWEQRYISGGQVASAALDGGVRRHVADPSVILEIMRDPNYDGQVVAGSFAPGSDPAAVAEAISAYERRFVGYVEIGAEFWRGSSDPRSGIALSLDRTGRIEAQRRYGPLFAPVDAELLSITAVMVNRAVGAPLVAEDGWRVEHLALPAPIEQRRIDREETLAMLKERLLSRAEARARITGEDLETARAAIAELDAEAAAAAPDTDPDTDPDEGDDDDQEDDHGR